VEVLTEAQNLLLGYLTASKVSLAERLNILDLLWKPEATMEMHRYIAETKESDLTKLSSTAYEISKKYNSDTE